MRDPVWFKSTIWTLVARAARDPKALSDLLAQYRPPILNFLIAGGRAEPDAEDLVQEVFLRISRPGFMERALDFQGKFRTLLLTVTKRVRTDAARIAQAAKRGGGAAPLSLERLREDAFDPPAPAEESDDTFDRLWVQNLLRQAIATYRTHCEKRGSDQYAIFNDHVFGGQKQEAVAAKFGQSVQDVKNAVFAARQKLRKLVEDLVRDYSLTDSAFASERAHLERHLRV